LIIFCQRYRQHTPMPRLWLSLWVKIQPCSSLYPAAKFSQFLVAVCTYLLQMWDKWSPSLLKFMRAGRFLSMLRFYEPVFTCLGQKWWRNFISRKSTKKVWIRCVCMFCFFFFGFSVRTVFYVSCEGAFRLIRRFYFVFGRCGKTHMVWRGKKPRKMYKLLLLFFNFYLHTSFFNFYSHSSFVA